MLQVDSDQADAHIPLTSSDDNPEEARYDMPEPKAPGSEETSKEVYTSLALKVLSVVFLLSVWGMIFQGDGQWVLFTWHPALQSLAIVFFIFGILSIQPSPPTSQIRQKRFEYHQILLSLFLPIIILGTAAVSYNKFRRSSNHLVSWHGKIGALSVLWSIVQLGFGVATVWEGGRLLGGGAKAKKFYKYHRLSGYVLVVAMFFTAFLGGAYSHWATADGRTILRILAFWISLPLITVALYLRVKTSKMQFR